MASRFYGLMKVWWFRDLDLKKIGPARVTLVYRYDHHPNVHHPES
jgi:hypothetical protein